MEPTKFLPEIFLQQDIEQAGKHCVARVSAPSPVLKKQDEYIFVYATGLSSQADEKQVFYSRMILHKNIRMKIRASCAYHPG